MSAAPPSDAGRWARFAGTLAGTALALLALLLAFVVAADPYGARSGPGRRPVPIMDTNQRYMYPQLARSNVFDSAVFGTSTARLLDPKRLDDVFGGRFANLAVNGATPWEQVQLAALFLRHTPAPRTLLFGLDRPWCDSDADHPGKRVAAGRTFPTWLYDDDPLNDIPHLLDTRSLEIAFRVAFRTVSREKPRIRDDGFRIFTPPDASYDLARARGHLRDDREVGRTALDAGEPVSAPFPALTWLSELLARLPATTRVALLLPPLHVAGQSSTGSAGAARQAACKAAIAAAAPRAIVVDYRVPSAITTADANFWDRLHFREGVANRIVADLKAVADGATASADGSFRVLRSANPDR